MKLSVIVPSIRPQNWRVLYESIKYSFTGSFELIFISPYPKPTNNLYRHPIHWVQSFRSPNACQQQGLSIAQGEYIAFAADDGVFLPGALDKAISYLDNHNHFSAVVGKYLEGDTPHPDMNKEDYYKFGYHKAYRLKGVPQEALIFNCGVIPRSTITFMGGYDAEHFDCTTLGHADFSVRAYKAGIELVLQDEVIFQCSHQPGKSGDHKPVHEAMKKDLKTFKKLYSKPRQTRIDLDNWKKTPEVWKERFK